MHRFDLDNVAFARRMRDKGLFVSISSGVKASDHAMVDRLAAEGVGADYITIDIAHGHADSVRKTIEHIKKRLPTAFVIAGNVGTPEGVIDLENWGADATKVGIGPGKVCITRLKTGFGTGGWQLSALKWCARVATKPIVADGGIRHHGDIAKSVRFGAAMVMIGSLFAGHEESPGPDGRGRRQAVQGVLRLGLDFNKGEYKHVEGKRILEPIKGKLADTLREMREDLQSSISYAGGRVLADLRKVNYVDPRRRERRRALVHVRCAQPVSPGLRVRSAATAESSSDVRPRGCDVSNRAAVLPSARSRWRRGERRTAEAIGMVARRGQQGLGEAAQWLGEVLGDHAMGVEAVEEATLVAGVHGLEVDDAVGVAAGVVGRQKADRLAAGRVTDGHHVDERSQCIDHLFAGRAGTRALSARTRASGSGH